jgi:hypothetical protein
LTTIHEILKDYPIINNVNELLDSDILILPIKKKDGSFGQKQPLGLAYLNKDLRVKFYCNGNPSLRFEASCESFLDLGNLIILANFLASLATISDYIKKFHKDDNVKTTIVHGNVYNNCQINVYQGNGSDVSRDILTLKDNFR